MTHLPARPTASGPAGPEPRVEPDVAYLEYDELAEAAAALVIGSYSTSFGLATRLLDPSTRRHVRNIYALVRVADEIVDAPRPGQGPHERRLCLDTFERETLSALTTQASSNLIVHAFARTAGVCGIDEAVVRPFFASMRCDLDRSDHDEATLVDYVHGSAEVVGLMCLRAFLAEEPERQAGYDRMAPGAKRLGAAFQKVNFLRDIGQDASRLGRHYLPGVAATGLSEADLLRWLDEIDADLAAAALVLPALPRRSRVAVCAAHDLFGELAARLRATPAAVVSTQRVRVPSAVKARLVAGAALRGGRPRVVRRARAVPDHPS